MTTPAEVRNTLDAAMTGAGFTQNVDLIQFERGKTDPLRTGPLRAIPTDLGSTTPSFTILGASLGVQVQPRRSDQIDHGGVLYNVTDVQTDPISATHVCQCSHAGGRLSV